MKKFTLSLYCITLCGFCQVYLCNSDATAISEEQKTAITSHCDSIKDSLKKVQQNDSKTRVYLGSHYETILSKYITPLNVKLVEENLSSPELIENQNKFATSKKTFASDFTHYQQSLEELVLLDCKKDPENFYNKLDVTRERRKIMEQDVLNLRRLISEHIKLVNGLKSKL